MKEQYDDKELGSQYYRFRNMINSNNIYNTKETHAETCTKWTRSELICTKHSLDAVKQKWIYFNFEMNINISLIVDIFFFFF